MNKHTILVIDDSPELRENLNETLSMAGYNVLLAENGKKGVEQALHHHPDLILCDLMMPEMDGFGALYNLSRNPSTAVIPFIFLSGQTERTDIRKAMLLGADDYITKPFEELELFQAIEARLRKTSLLKQEFERGVKGYEAFVDEVKKLSDLHNIPGKGQIKSYNKKNHIFRERQYPNYVYLVEQGKLKTFKVNEQGKEYTTNIYKEGDFFGYLPVFEDKPYPESAEVLEDSEIYQIPKNDFLELLNGNHTIAIRFIQLLSDNLIENEQRLIDLAYNSVRKRVAQTLVFLDDKYKNNSDESTSINIGRDDLASIAGTSIESTVRVLSDFKIEGLIEITGKSIAILDVPRLAHMRN